MSTTTPQFAIARFKNASGTVSWRVSGWLAGVRIRKNLKTRQEAATEKSQLEIRAAQAASGLRMVTTFLADDQLRESEAAFRRLPPGSHTLTFYLDYAMANFREPTASRPLTEAVAEYLTTKQREHDQRMLSISQLNHIRRHLTIFGKWFPGLKVSDLTAHQLEAYCRRGNASPKTFNNRRGILSTFFKFAYQKDWVAANLIEKLPYHKIAHRRGSARTLSADQVQTLMDFVEGYRGGRLVPYFALCLFAGIRPCLRDGEASKLQPEHVRLDTGVVHIEPEVSKTGMKRNVTIQPNLAAWLEAYPLSEITLVPPNMQHLRSAISRRFKLSHDVMRHTFISMFVAKFRSMGEAALQAGNSEAIIRKHYLDLKNPAEAERFFSILPKRKYKSHGKDPENRIEAFPATSVPLSLAG
jgi:integrase